MGMHNAVYHCANIFSHRSNHNVKKSDQSQKWNTRVFFSAPEMLSFICDSIMYQLIYTLKVLMLPIFHSSFTVDAII